MNFRVMKKQYPLEVEHGYNFNFIMLKCPPFSNSRGIALKLF
jgi:hypothetical protein